MASSIDNDTTTTSSKPGWSKNDDNSREQGSAQHVHFNLVDSQPIEPEERPKSGIQPVHPSPSTRPQGEQSDLEATATQAITHGSMPLLATETPYIRKEEFDENAMPFGTKFKAPTEDESHITATAIRPRLTGGSDRPQSGLDTPSPEDYRDTVPAHKPGVLATLLKLAQDPGSEPPMAFKRRSQTGSATESTPSGSGAVTPSKWYRTGHTSTAALLAGTSAQLADAYVGLRRFGKGGEEDETKASIKASFVNYFSQYFGILI
ncbi:hypothetical protein ABW21_db0203094 [Orbilia brochopaga]|nr:hypothetical protein ABW21_db0203094 [Drechslerella brochopaga]